MQIARTEYLITDRLITQRDVQSLTYTNGPKCLSGKKLNPMNHL